MWEKKGIVLDLSELNSEWITSHVQLPLVYRINEDVLRIYIAVRNAERKALPVYVDIDAHDFRIIEKHTEPLLQLGNPGTFDDCGIMFASCVEVGDSLYMYYIGWNRDALLPYSLSIGLAVSKDRGGVFTKVSDGPIMDRDIDCPYFNTNPFVLRENGIFQMWYVFCTKWEYEEEDGWVPAYLIKRAVSDDGIHWRREEGACIDYKNDHEAIAAPCIIKTNDQYYMWYCYRDLKDFRKGKDNAYMIGVATSPDGKHWVRKDDKVGISKSETGWDSEMMCYPSVIELDDKLVMFYNGNEHGKYAIGYAVCRKDDLVF